MTKTLIVAMLAAATIAAAFALPLDTASAFVVAGKTTKAPQGYHVDGFQGWNNGYRVAYKKCAPTSKLGTCAQGVRAFQPL